MRMARKLEQISAVIATGLLLTLGACGGDDSEEDAGGDAGQDTATQDTGTPDDTTNPDDTGGPGDTGSPTDTGEDAGNDSGMTGDAGNDTGNDAGPCSLFPDDCPDDQKCYATPDMRQCGSYNADNKEGDSCGRTDPCDEGLFCDQSRTCRFKCNPDDLQNYGCPDDQTCVQGVDREGNEFPYGLCQNSCEPWPNDSCGEGENCYPNGEGDTLCLAFDSNKAEGDSCDAVNACGEDLFCLSQTCTSKCDPDNLEMYGCSDGKTCARVENQNGDELPFGACVSQ